MKSRKTTLLFLKLPPPYGGGEMICQVISNKYNNDSNYIIFANKINKSSRSSQGKFNVVNIFSGFQYFFGIISGLIKYRPKSLYIVLPKNFIPFFRDSFIILISRFLGVRIKGDLSGTSFLFMKKGTMKYKYGLFIFKRIHKVRILGDNVKKYIPFIDNDKMEVFSNGIEIPSNKSVNKEIFYKETLNILYVGALEESKGIRELIGLVSLCKENDLSIKLNIIGEWSDKKFEKEISETIEGKELNNYINIYGLKIDDDKWDIFCNNAILVHPTLWDGQPVTILEAMGLGLPLITTNVGAIPDTVINCRNGFVLENNQPETVYAALLKLYKDRRLIEEYSDNCIADFRQKYTSEIFLKNFDNYLNRKDKKKNINVLEIGVDTSSNGGIATVVKTLYRENKKYSGEIDIELLKTSYYKDKNRIYEFYILTKSLLLFTGKLIGKKIDVLQIECSSGISFVRKSVFVVLGKIFRKKIILHIHASNFEDYFINSNSFIRYFNRIILKKTDLIILLCDYLKELFDEKYKNLNVHVVFNPIAPIEYNKIRKSNDDNKLKVLFVGFLEEKKGILDILEAAKLLKEKKINGIEIQIAGKGKLEKKLISEIRDYNLGNIINYVGWVDGPEKDDLYNISDIFFLPSYKEAMPMVILEAMNHSLPVISTRIAGIPEMVIDGWNGFLFEPGDIEGYVDKLILLKDDREMIKELGINAKKQIQKFDSRKIYGDIENIYHELVKE